MRKDGVSKKVSKINKQRGMLIWHWRMNAIPILFAKRK